MAKKLSDGKQIGIRVLLIILLIVGGVIAIEIVGRIFGYSFPLPGISAVQNMAFRQRVKRAEDPYLLEREELAKLEESLSLQEEFLMNRESEISSKETEVDKKIEALKERENELNLKADQIEARETAYNDRQRNIREQAEKLYNMPPASAVELLEQQSETDIVDILRGIDRYAEEIGSPSTSGYLLTLFQDKTKSASVFRKLQYYSEDVTAVDILEDENLEEPPSPE